MPNVQLPSGEVIAFPEGMSDADIDREVRRFLISQNAEENAARLAPAPPEEPERERGISQIMGPGGRGSFGGTGNVGARAAAGGLGVLLGLTPAAIAGVGTGTVTGLVADQATDRGLRAVGVPAPVADVAGDVVGVAAGGGSGGVVRALVKRGARPTLTQFLANLVTKKARETGAREATKVTAPAVARSVVVAAATPAATTATIKTAVQLARQAGIKTPRGGKIWLLLNNAGKPIKALTPDQAGAAKRAGQATTWVVNVFG